MDGSGMTAVLILIGSIWLTAPPAAHGGADTEWAKHRKFVAGSFNNWTPTSMTGPDSNGLYKVTVRLVPGTYKYKFVTAINGTDTQWEPTFSTSDGNRALSVPSGVDTFYVPMNWADTPPAPTVTTTVTGIGEVLVAWTIASSGGLDVTYGGGYHLYERSGQSGPPWTQVDTELLKTTSCTVRGLTVDTTYYFILTAVDAYDTPYVPTSDSPAPPGPYTSTSASVTVTPKGAILVQFIVDLRQDIMKNGAPKFGMAVAGNLSPLTWSPYKQPLHAIQTGVYSETFSMVSGQSVEYKYVKNPGTSKQVWEGSDAEKSTLFRFDPAAWGLDAKNVTEAYVRGTFNGWNVSSDWKMTLESDSVFRMVKSITSAGTYKYFVYHSLAPGGDWIPSGSDLSLSLSDIPSQFTYGPDSTAVAVYAVGDFDPWSANNWQSNKPDNFYKLNVDNRKMWRLTRYMPTGTHSYKFTIDSTNDGVKNPSYESGSDRTLKVTGNRLITVAANYGSSMMRVVDVWEEAGFGPPKSPVSVTAISMDSKVLLSWKPAAEFNVSSYRIYRDTETTGSFPLVGTVTASMSIPEYTDTTVTNGKTYYYKITAYDTGNLLESNFSSGQEGMPASGDAMARRMADGQAKSVTVEFPGGTLPAGTYMRITSLLEAIDEEASDTRFAALVSAVSEADEAQKTDPLAWAMSENMAGDSDSLIYIVDLKSKTTDVSVTLADSPVQITIPYSDTHESLASQSEVPIGYALYVLNEETRRWELVPGTAANRAAQVVSAPRYHFSVFQVMAVAGAPNNLNNMVAYPNPCYPNRSFAQSGDPYGSGQPGMTFIDIPTDIQYIKIYTITGDLVRTLDPSDPREYSTTGAATRMIWDLHNDADQNVASGVYLFFAKSATSTMKGKVAVVR